MSTYPKLDLLDCLGQNRNALINKFEETKRLSKDTIL
jgi:hypothetical protein